VPPQPEPAAPLAGETEPVVPDRLEAGNDVFISYARADQEITRRLAETLWSEGFEVWFDNKIPTGSRWNADIMDRLTRAKAVLVVWTSTSLQRPWVLKEADFARRQNKLVPIMVEDVEAQLPPRFKEMLIAKMIGWDGSGHHPELARVLDGLALLAPASHIENVRPGFDCGFLGDEIPLPAVSGVAEELRYLHFSVVVNPARRLPWYVAYNLAPRNALARRSDQWRPDPKLPLSFQPQDVHFRGTGFDRGHIAAAGHVSWGSEREAEIANHQAFFWTNTVPQHRLMNQRWWLSVEVWEREAVLVHGKAIGFAGPVLAAADPVHTTSESMIGRLRVRENFRLPQRFWKVVVFCGESGRLRYAAFLFDQAALLANQTRTCSARDFQVSLDEIQIQTGLVFDALAAAEPMEV
jgi:DNA/RNA endonuclease G (NUC1)